MREPHLLVTMDKLKAIFKLFADTVATFLQDKATIYAAGLAYYTVFSLAPLMVLVLAVAGYFIGRSNASSQVVAQLQFIFGPQLSVFVEDLVAAVNEQVNTRALTLLSIGGLIIGASGIFNQLKNSLNILWGIVVDRPSGWREWLHLIRSRAIPVLMVFVVGLLFSLSVMMETIFSAVDYRLRPFFPDLVDMLPLAQRVIIPALTLVTFTLVYKFLPDARTRWRDAGLGALLAAALFLAGRYFLAIFLTFQNTGSAFGAAGSLVVLLVWIFFSANLLLVGAEFIKVYTQRFGRPIRPARLAHFEGEPVIEEPHPSPFGVEPDERVM